MQTYKAKFSTLSSTIPHKSVYYVLLEMVCPFDLWRLIVAGMEHGLFRSISYLHDVYLKLSLFSSPFHHESKGRKANLNIFNARTICEKMPIGIHKVRIRRSRTFVEPFPDIPRTERGYVSYGGREWITGAPYTGISGWRSNWWAKWNFPANVHRILFTRWHWETLSSWSRTISE